MRCLSLSTIPQRKKHRSHYRSISDSYKGKVILAFTLFFGTRGKRLVTSASYLPDPKGGIQVSIVRQKRMGQGHVFGLCSSLLEIMVKSKQSQPEIEKVRRGFLSKREKRKKFWSIEREMKVVEKIKIRQSLVSKQHILLHFEASFFKTYYKPADYVQYSTH